MRTYLDTQIFKEVGFYGTNCQPTPEEWKIINDYPNANPYQINQDNANGIFAISFNNINQKTNPDWGDNLVNQLNQQGNGNWFLGDIEEEYVFCD